MLRLFFLITLIILLSNCSEQKEKKNVKEKKLVAQKELNGRVKKITESCCISSSCRKFDTSNKESSINTIYLFDTSGNNFLILMYNNIKKRLDSIHKKFDSAGFLLEEITTSYKSSIKYSYSTDRKKQYAKYFFMDSLQNEQLKRYDDSGRIIEYETFLGTLVYSKQKYNYQHKSGRVVTTVTEKDKPFKEEIKVFDSLNNPLEIKSTFFASGNRIAFSYFTYKYDQYGNWIYRIEKNEYGDTRSIYFRRIEYY